MSTIKVTNLRHESASSSNITLDSSNNVTTANNFTAGGTIGCTGNLTVTSGNVVLSSGNGIDFSAAGNASGMTSELLDDYEEGTWTPTLNGTATYSTQVGIYTKIGRLVSVSFDIAVSTLGTGSTTTISGLPFTVSNSPNGESRGATGYFASLATSVIALTCYANANTSSVKFISMSSSGGTATINPAIFGNSARVQGSVAYIV